MKKQQSWFHVKSQLKKSSYPKNFKVNRIAFLFQPQKNGVQKMWERISSLIKGHSNQSHKYKSGLMLNKIANIISFIIKCFDF